MNQVSGMHLAELNVGRLMAPTDDPCVAEFMDGLGRVNTYLKEAQGGKATAARKWRRSRKSR